MPSRATIIVTAAILSEAELGRIADRTEAEWASMDAARIKALYAPQVVGSDVTTAPLATDRPTWDKQQDAFAAAKLDKIVETSRKIQILAPDIFVLSGMGDLTSAAVPANNATMRFTDVFQKQADGSWLIVNEHVSIAPKG